MKLLFDQNLSFRLLSCLSDIFPHASHVRDHSLAQAGDETVWEFAKTGGFLIVTKDEDFHQRSFLYGHPPKVIWLRLGNCSTKQLESLIRWHASKIHEFKADPSAAILILP